MKQHYYGATTYCWSIKSIKYYHHHIQHQHGYGFWSTEKTWFKTLDQNIRTGKWERNFWATLFNRNFWCAKNQILKQEKHFEEWILEKEKDCWRNKDDARDFQATKTLYPNFPLQTFEQQKTWATKTWRWNEGFLSKKNTLNSEECILKKHDSEEEWILKKEKDCWKILTQEILSNENFQRFYIQDFGPQNTKEFWARKRFVFVIQFFAWINKKNLWTQHSITWNTI